MTDLSKRQKNYKSIRKSKLRPVATKPCKMLLEHFGDDLLIYLPTADSLVLFALECTVSERDMGGLKFTSTKRRRKKE